MTYDVLKIHKEALTIRAYFLNNLLKTQYNNQILQLDQKKIKLWRVEITESE